MTPLEKLRGLDGFGVGVDREQVGLRKQVQDLLDDLLGPGDRREPLMNDGNSGLGRHSGKNLGFRNRGQ